jgi:hypothetical protein
MSDAPARSAARKTVAGWPIGRVIATIVLLIALIWAAWITRLLLDISRRQIVSVSLSTLVSDFVAAESRNGGTPEQTASRTAAYLAAVNQAVSALGANGTTVIVTEATLGKTVPDRTGQVRAAVKRALEGDHDPR